MHADWWNGDFFQMRKFVKRKNEKKSVGRNSVCLSVATRNAPHTLKVSNYMFWLAFMTSWRHRGIVKTMAIILFCIFVLKALEILQTHMRRRNAFATSQTHCLNFGQYWSLSAKILALALALEFIASLRGLAKIVAMYWWYLKCNCDVTYAYATSQMPL